ncbi:hypothetical protein [Shinella kummerowiae]|uniref:hypothetical protein n=1 Tax=Shinella kummerowiae TaxID=417745 RepID=UPI0021B61A20|nr:hypothetical protein [Shinella kummerowiae]MCT7662687.1 hypothetical protein [Shinella kummerowiae]
MQRLSNSPDPVECTIQQIKLEEKTAAELNLIQIANKLAALSVSAKSLVGPIDAVNPNYPVE